MNVLLSEWKAASAELDRLVKQATGPRPFNWTVQNVMWAMTHEGLGEEISDSQWAEIDAAVRRCLDLEYQVECR